MTRLWARCIARAMCWACAPYFRPLHFLSQLVRSALVYRSFLKSLKQVAASVDVVKRQLLREDMKRSKRFLVAMMLGHLDRPDASESLEQLARDGGAACTEHRKRLLEVVDGVVIILHPSFGKHSKVCIVVCQILLLLGCALMSVRQESRYVCLFRGQGQHSQCLSNNLGMVSPQWCGST